MAGRPKIYTSNAERQQHYRERLANTTQLEKQEAAAQREQASKNRALARRIAADTVSSYAHGRLGEASENLDETTKKYLLEICQFLRWNEHLPR
jgi:hypothetical protein